jgi:TPR repeat protein
MRISDTIAPVGLFMVGLGLASALAFDGGRAPNDFAPAVSVDMVPRTAMTAPLTGTPTEPVTIPSALGFNNLRVPEAQLKLTPVEAFRWGAQALRIGNIPPGVRALEYAAANGHPLAQWKLGRMFADGDGVKQDEVRAFEYFREIADAHAEDSPGTRMAFIVANAFVSLGTYYLDGIPNSQIKADPERAREMFAYAASYFGDRDAQYNLARLYLDGNGVARDPRVAARWLNLAADKGQHQAQAMLGDMLFKGNDVARRAALGLMWLTLARDSATPQDAWIVQLHDAASKKATDDERALALTLLERRLKGERE